MSYQGAVDVVKCGGCGKKVRNWDYNYCPYCNVTWVYSR